MRLFYIPFCIVGACTAVLAYQLLGPNGAFFHVEDLRQSLAEQQRQNEQQRLKNEELRAELASLENGTEAIEERARRDLYMIKVGEVLFRLETPNDYDKRMAETSTMPDYRNPEAKSGARATFSAKRGDLYHSPRARSAQ